TSPSLLAGKLRLFAFLSRRPCLAIGGLILAWGLGWGKRSDRLLPAGQGVRGAARCGLACGIIT
ncbi:MAG: hypothetical protein V3S50_04915, partial [Acidobacteriota bacterium]